MFSLPDAAHAPLRNNLAFRSYDLYRETGKEKYLLAAFRYTLPMIGRVATRLRLDDELDWDDTVQQIAIQLYAFLAKKHWQVTHPGGYYSVVSSFAMHKGLTVRNKLHEKPIPPEVWLPYGLPRGRVPHPQDTLVEMYEEEIVKYVRLRVPDMIRCSEAEREAIPFCLDQIFRGVELSWSHLNGSVRQERKQLLLDRIAICCRRAMYELEDEAPVQVRAAVRRTWEHQPQPFQS